jgi:hypothetical protein
MVDRGGVLALLCSSEYNVRQRSGRKADDSFGVDDVIVVAISASQKLERRLLDNLSTCMQAVSEADCFQFSRVAVFQL